MNIQTQHMISSRMGSVMLSVLLLVQFPTIFGFVIESKVCADLIAYSSSYGNELFYVNGNLVGKDLFCEALFTYNENGCNIEEHLKSDYCQFYVSTGRKLLPKGSTYESTVPAHDGEGKSESKFLSTPKQFGILAGGSVLACCVFICPCFYRKRKETSHTALTKEQNSTDRGYVTADSVSSFDVNSVHEKIPASPFRVPPSPRHSMSPQLSRLGSVHLNMIQVAKATRNFSPSLQIGEGGFGTVYKAQLEDGHIVAIKRGKKEHFENLRNEFSSEVELLAKIDHRNLVKLLGFIDQGNERLVITEYVPNGTLREHLDGQRGKILDFNQRLEIAIDVAHGLTYLHLYAEKPIIHRDVKSSNILLTESMRAKVADFGFAKLGPMESDETHISTKVKGTVGYLDPEYMKTYQLTAKSDVYSFGILLMEIMTGRRPVELRRPVEERVTVRWAFERYNDGRVVELVDPLMQEVVNAEILNKIFNLAFECAAPIRSKRPDMKLVGEQLWAIRADYVRSLRRV
ncbi:calmodulin-binding receptor-like cytoplasmic kinase 3 isoform X1 [Morus notabilis]|uniref:calmodulin-binding receptor-like cytoplasmic kinase 3 isoform X1 n=1 Tax=Morus notabilis TaxID=981085 RepID=UPI000CECF589|nr:calmodulin-binding receptor-like cytoplasmic kinase 3 isoform X1 [Morus notabilis]